MVRKRFTEKELNRLTNKEMMTILIRERQTDCVNPASPFYVRLRSLEDWIGLLPDNLGDFEIKNCKGARNGN